MRKFAFSSSIKTSNCEARRKIAKNVHPRRFYDETRKPVRRFEAELGKFLRIRAKRRAKPNFSIEFHVIFAQLLVKVLDIGSRRRSFGQNTYFRISRRDGGRVWKFQLFFVLSSWAALWMRAKNCADCDEEN